MIVQSFRVKDEAVNEGDVRYLPGYDAMMR